MPNICLVNTGFPTNGSTSRSVAKTRSLWSQGKQLRIYFLNGTSIDQNTFLTAVRAWLFDAYNQQRTSLSYTVVAANQQSDIRVFFANNGVSWSYIGTEANGVAQNEPTLHLGNGDLDNAIHEFGHALGLLHEHGNPAANIQWNRQALYELGDRIGWTNQMIDEQIIARYDPRNVSYTDFDRLSAMIYPIEPGWTLDGFSQQRNLQPSPTDLEFLMQLYPIGTTTNTNTNTSTTNTGTTDTMMMMEDNSTTKSGGAGLAIAALIALIAIR